MQIPTAIQILKQILKRQRRNRKRRRSQSQMGRWLSSRHYKERKEYCQHDENIPRKAIVYLAALPVLLALEEATAAPIEKSPVWLSTSVLLPRPVALSVYPSLHKKLNVNRLPFTQKRRDSGLTQEKREGE
jgi:hypothetical protein